MEKAKWHRELELFLQIKPCLLLEGNVLDQFPYPGAPHPYYLPEYLYHLLKSRGYESVVLYDETLGFHAVKGGEGDLGTLVELCAPLSLHPLGDRLASPFVGRVDLEGALGIGQMGAQRPAPVSAGQIVECALGQAEVPVAVIMDFASRYIVSPDRMEASDVHAFADLMRAIRSAAEAQAGDSPVKNTVLLLVNKVNDLPAWFYFSNPDVKPIHIATPDSQCRFDFVSGQQWKGFFQPEILEADLAEHALRPEQLRKLINRFVGMTDGFTYTDLVGIRTVCYRGGYHITQLPKVVELYRYGIRENKWEAIKADTIEDLKQDLFSKILGQDSALCQVLDVMKRSVLGVGAGASNRPKGVLFFAGPTGTGKTETAKALARRIFGDESCLIRFDMSEYGQSHSDQKLLGAPPGYIGYEAGGQLTNAVRSNPFSILLFDEIEKAHPSILDKFLQILDDGRLTDGQGNTVYFSESILIFTSNQGTREDVLERDEEGRVNRKKKRLDPSASYAQTQRRVVAGIRRYFEEELGRSELLNRIGEDNIVVYQYISEEAAEQILRLHIREAMEVFHEVCGIYVDVTPVEPILLGHCRSPEVLKYGGRGIRNAVESCLSTPLARFLYDAGDERVPKGSRVVVTGLDLEEIPVGIRAEVR